ncbi:MAG: primosomal protein DnaI [Bacilli bacterium]|nr:primosomal protein DnaI [Bacilli bacterium]
MIKAKEKLDEKINNNLTDIKLEYFKSRKDDGFKSFTDKIDLSDDYLMKYNFELMQCYKECENCKKCKGLNYCLNEVKGCVYTPKIVDSELIFNYKTCKYKNDLLNTIEYLKDSYVFSVSRDVMNAKMKDIYTDDKNRIEVIKWITKFIKDYKDGKKVKGLYLSGNFGSGKSYLVSAMINELIKDGKKGALVYYPNFLLSLKSSFGKDFNEQFEYAKNADLLLFDDIGTENVTPWSRDEILASILQYRMEEGLPTFFTSNLTIEELELHLSADNKKVDKLKAKRIIERISYMCDEIKLISKNNRR